MMSNFVYDNLTVCPEKNLEFNFCLNTHFQDINNELCYILVYRVHDKLGDYSKGAAVTEKLMSVINKII
jgi:hypothetical protein